ncbi:Translin-associated factor X-interacting protein 1 [Orchesella cincta]|uniref:Translin-associated factor X-interacting protein 1 n=1 Tax=Orchesella cincta TaxID=48709 RepID=A0A1D2NFH9_ORCCI|nr:Translin-associated factor X-interacting protein 1 [Orchesella cincta]
MPRVQEVIQSEAVKRLWDIINSQLELFNAKDPLAYEMFGVLFDEVRSFVKLPEEDIADFNNGVWEPEPLDEKKILLMEPSEKLLTRFGVYQKAFCFLAQHFETITPMFAEVKQAYEDVFDKGEKETLEVEKEKMEELELRQTLGKYVRHTDKAGHRLLVQVKAEAHALQEHLQWQHHTLHTILGMLWKMRSSLKVTSWAVTQLKGLHKTKIEALAREIVSTQGQMLFDMALPGKYTEIMQRIRNQADPKEIRQMLLAVRRQLKKAHKKIVIYEADYADTVPKSEFEVPQKKFGIISKKNQALQETCNSLKTERQRLKQAIAALKSDIYETSGLVKDLRRKPTPRPSWTKISNEWPEGQPKFMQIREGNSTREVINKVVEKLTGKPVGEVSVYMKPLGRGDHVPPYLRYDKPLLDRSFTAVEAGMFVKDIWQKRVEIVKLYRIIKQARRDEEEGIASYPEDLQYEYPVVGTFPEYVTEYFEKRCYLEQIRMEWVYNLIDACRRHSTDLKLVQFKGTLDGFIDESIYHLFHMELDKLRDVMYAKANESYEHKGYVQWPDLIKNIYRLYPAKTEEEIAVINQMGTSLGVRGTWAVVRIQLLFEADDNGKESDFVELLYKQFENERHLYIRDIYMEILTELGISEKLLDHKDDPVWQTDVSMHMFYAGVTSVDPTIPDVKLIAYLAWVYLGVTALPGVASLGTKLVDFLRERAYLTEADLEKYNEDEDIEFENCIKEIRDYEDEESTMDKLDLKKRRLATKKLKFASLRQVMDRLYSGPFLRYGLRAVKNKPEDGETDPEKRRQHKQGQDEDDGEEDGDVAVADI